MSNYRITTRGTVRFLASLESSCSPRVLSSSNQEYLSIRQTDSSGTWENVECKDWRQVSNLSYLDGYEQAEAGTVVRVSRSATVFH